MQICWHFEENKMRSVDILGELWTYCGDFQRKIGDFWKFWEISWHFVDILGFWDYCIPDILALSIYTSQTFEQLMLKIITPHWHSTLKSTLTPTLRDTNINIGNINTEASTVSAHACFSFVTSRVLPDFRITLVKSGFNTDRLHWSKTGICSMLTLGQLRAA